MAVFKYFIRTDDGIRREGEIEASNISEAGELLKKDGNVTIVKREERDTSFDFMGPFLDRLNQKITRMKNRVPLNSMVFFVR